jgi:hypothetical protein
MTNTHTHTHTHTQNFWGKCVTFVNNNKTVLVAATIAGNLANILTIMSTVVQFTEVVNPKSTGLTDQWVLVKITGWSVGSYKPNELQGTSKLTPIIYTDNQPTDMHLTSGISPKEDFSVLKNVDYVGILPQDANEKTVKRNSQTLQARLIQASKNEEPVCLRVYGKRDNSKSQFFNIVQFKTVEPEIQKEYDELKNKNHSDTQYQELTQRACPNS